MRADTGWRPLGWAGLLMELPEPFRLIRTEGTGERGAMVVADADRTRLRVSWATVGRRRFDAERFIRRKLIKAARKSRRKPEDFISLKHDCFQPLLLDSSDDADLDRCVGYCQATSRVIEWVFHGPSEGKRNPPNSTEQILAATRDQPLDQPTRWAFFDVSFIAPVGFAYRGATLNLGDMRVNLGVRSSMLAGPWLSIRHVYPASLALARQPLEAWHRDWCGGFRKAFRPGGKGFANSLLNRGQPAIAEEATPRGPLLATAARARPGPRLQHWRMPARARLCTLHDQPSDRIVTLFAADRAERVGPLIGEVIAGLHWAPVRDGMTPA